MGAHVEKLSRMPSQSTSPLIQACTQLPMLLCAWRRLLMASAHSSLLLRRMQRLPSMHVKQRAARSASLNACLLCCQQRPLCSALTLQAETDNPRIAAGAGRVNSCRALISACASRKVCQSAICRCATEVCDISTFRDTDHGQGCDSMRHVS
jgi:hypothetical protein